MFHIPPHKFESPAADAAPEAPAAPARTTDHDKGLVGIQAISFLKNMVAFNFIPDHHLAHALRILKESVEAYSESKLFTTEEIEDAMRVRAIYQEAK